MAIKLSERAVLATLRIGNWSGTLYDDAVTEEVSQHRKAAKGAGRYNTLLVDRGLLRGIGSAISLARRTHHLLTLPWADDARIMSTVGYMHYTEQMRQRRLDVEQEADRMIKLYPAYISSSENKVRLGQMWSADDYPTVEELKEKFYIDVEIKQVPDAADFRAKLSDASVKSIVKDIEQRGNERVKAALNDVFKRIADQAEHMMERLRAYKPAQGPGRAENIFRDSVIYNLTELTELLPSLNITNDPRIDKLQKDIQEHLTSSAPEMLRANENLRNQTAAKAEAILAKVKQYMA